jgi:glycosyltransferase involved in cell wall biosynthesis
VTAVSAFLRQETQRLLSFEKAIDVIHNFFVPRQPRRSRMEVRKELGIGDEALILHSSNLRPVKRIDLLLETAARIRPRESFKLVILAGDSFALYAELLQRLELQDRVIVREKVVEVEAYLQAADLTLFSSEMESFCLSILEGMFFACPGVAMRVGGIPEVLEDKATGLLTPFGDVEALAAAVESLIHDPQRRREFGIRGSQVARAQFSADVIVPRYEALYRRVCQM